MEKLVSSQYRTSNSLVGFLTFDESLHFYTATSNESFKMYVCSGGKKL